jgi:hypothetical protein
MKIWMFILVLFISCMASAQIKIDTTRLQMNRWAPTDSTMEISYNKQWAESMRKDTILLRGGQYFFVTSDTNAIQCWFDSVQGMGNNRVTYWTVTSVRPHNISSLKTSFPYNVGFQPLDYAQRYPNCYTRSWPKQVNASKYQFQSSDTSFSVRTTMDTLVVDTSIVFMNSMTYNKTYYFRVRTLYINNTYGPWNSVDPALSVSGTHLILLDIKGKNVILVRPLKLVNDAERTQVQVEVSCFTNPTFKYAKGCP